MIKKQKGRQPIIIKNIGTKDWKQQWSSRQINAANNQAKKINGKVGFATGPMGTDSDNLFVYKGLSNTQAQKIQDRYGFVFGKVSGKSYKQITSKLKKKDTY